MKRVLVGLLIATVSVGLGVSSYFLVDYAKSKSNDIKKEKIIENSKTANKKDESSSSEGYDDSKQMDDKSTDNSSTNSESVEISSDTDSTVSEGHLDFTSPEAFIASYNNLVEKVGTKVEKSTMYSSSNRATLDYYDVGNLTIATYSGDSAVYWVYVNGKTIGDKLEVLLGDVQAEVTEVDGNTNISVLIAG